MSGVRFCPHCGAEVNPAAAVCIKCGMALQPAGHGAAYATHAPVSDRIMPSNPPKDPAVMGLLSGCLFVGLGQLVLGQTAKGLVMLLGTMFFVGPILGIVAALTFGLGLVFVPVVWLIAGLDAYLIAKKLQEGRSVGQWEFF